MTVITPSAKDLRALGPYDVEKVRADFPILADQKPTSLSELDT